MSKLEDIIAAMIEAEGPMPLDRYMALCLGHPVHGYYMTRDPFGASGDFTTAPEISQVFGELIGVWLINTWVSLGSPSPFALVELGPGRGTLMADVLRVAKSMPAFAAAAQVHLVETSPVLTGLQLEKLNPYIRHSREGGNPTLSDEIEVQLGSRLRGNDGQYDVSWHHTVETLPQIPCLIIANEFFDALPIQQFENRGGRWFERRVGFGEGKLKLGLVPAVTREGDEGIYESSPVSFAVSEDLGAHIAKHGGAALVVDYGHLKSAAGDTLQALRQHQFVSVLETPGEADVTAHVDFEALAKGFIAGGAELLPMLTQGQFLNAMGLDMRTSKLSAKLEGQAQSDFVSASARLAAPDQMGNLFKVMAVAQQIRQPIYPFEAA